jgi:hypothetical protein
MKRVDGQRQRVSQRIHNFVSAVAGAACFPVRVRRASVHGGIRPRQTLAAVAAGRSRKKISTPTVDLGSRPAVRQNDVSRMPVRNRSLDIARRPQRWTQWGTSPGTHTDADRPTLRPRRESPRRGPEGIAFDGKQFVRTGVTASAFRYLTTAHDSQNNFGVPNAKFAAGRVRLGGVPDAR